MSQNCLFLWLVWPVWKPKRSFVGPLYLDNATFFLTLCNSCCVYILHHYSVKDRCSFVEHVRKHESEEHTQSRSPAQRRSSNAAGQTHKFHGLFGALSHPIFGASTPNQKNGVAPVKQALKKKWPKQACLNGRVSVGPEGRYGIFPW